MKVHLTLVKVENSAITVPKSQPLIKDMNKRLKLSRKYRDWVYTNNTIGIALYIDGYQIL